MRGFTLVELVVVLLLLGLLSAAVAPALRTVAERTPAQHAREEIVALLASARRSALEQASTATLRLNTASLAWRLTVNSATKATATDGRLLLPAGTTLSDADGRVTARFYPDGTVDAEPVVASAAGVTEIVRLDRWTGRPE
jgi:prepilin-type N-terminal cleavage/methylation domain-containing protein